MEQDFLNKSMSQSEQSHTRRLVGMIILLIVAVLLATLAGYLFYKPTVNDVKKEEDPYATMRMLLNEPNPRVTLTQEEIDMREKAFKAVNPTIKLTPAEIELRKKLLNNN